MYASMLINPEDNGFNLADDYIEDVLEIYPEMEYYTGGQDIGLNIAGVKVGYNGDRVYVVKDQGGLNITTKTFNDQLTDKGWYDDDFPVYCDPAAGEGIKANNAVDPGIDYINSLIERAQFYISSECTGVPSEIWGCSRDEDDKTVKINYHYMDALGTSILFLPKERRIISASRI
jgi:hypothetical protein